MLFLVLELFFEHFKFSVGMLVLLRVKRLRNFLLVLRISVDEFQHAIKLPFIRRCLPSCDGISAALIE